MGLVSPSSSYHINNYIKRTFLRLRRQAIKSKPKCFDGGCPASFAWTPQIRILVWLHKQKQGFPPQPLPHAVLNSAECSTVQYFFFPFIVQCVVPYTQIIKAYSNPASKKKQKSSLSSCSVYLTKLFTVVMAATVITFSNILVI